MPGPNSPTLPWPICGLLSNTPATTQVMFAKSLLDSSNDEFVTTEAAAGSELARSVATLLDCNAHTDPVGPQLVAWSLVHGFSMFWLNYMVNNKVRSMDP